MTSRTCAALLTVALVTGCSAARRVPPPATEVAPPRDTRPLPPATAAPVLTIGNVPGPDGARDVRLDASGLASLATDERVYHEPFLKRDVRFRGVPMRDLLTRAGVVGGRLELSALDDYSFEADAADLMEDGVLLAVTADGKPIAVADGGPVRLVFQDRTTLGPNTDAWVWSLDEIQVTP